VTVQDYLRVLREQWLVIVSAVVVALVAACAVSLLRPPEYTARLTMYVSRRLLETAFEGAQLSQQRVSSYVELVSSTRVSREVIEELGLTGTPEEIAQQITASSTLDAVLIDVAVTGRSPEQVAAMANTVGDVFTGLVDELERPVTPGAVPPVAVRVVQPAPVPAAPSSTGLPVTLTLGLLAGLAVGVGGALARNALDTSVKSLEQLRGAANAPNLGTIAYDSDVPKRPLTVHEEPQSPRAEAFRQLRTNLQFVDVDNPRKVIVVTSSLPREGKTTTLCNLAIALASAGSKVLAIEGDLRPPKAADLFGLEPAVGLTSILAGRVRLEQAGQPWAGEGVRRARERTAAAEPERAARIPAHEGRTCRAAARHVGRRPDRLAAAAAGDRRGGRRPGHRRRDPGVPVQGDDPRSGNRRGRGLGRGVGAGAGDGLPRWCRAPDRGHTRSTTPIPRRPGDYAGRPGDGFGEQCPRIRRSCDSIPPELVPGLPVMSCHELKHLRAERRMKSTVPVGSAERTGELLERDDVAVVSNPEVLREGSAMQTSIPTASSSARSSRTRPSGSLRSTPVSVCRWSCLPKDTHVLLQVADSADFEFRLLRATIDTNTRQYQRMVDKIRIAVTGKRTGSLTRKRIALFELTFKAGTDDLRASPALGVAAILKQAGADLVAYDPGIMADTSPIDGSLLTMVDDPYLAAKDAEAIVILTEWPEFRALDWPLLSEVVGTPAVIDTRNLLDPDVFRRAAFTWTGVGRTMRTAALTRTGFSI